MFTYYKWKLVFFAFITDPAGAGAAIKKRLWLSAPAYLSALAPEPPQNWRLQAALTSQHQSKYLKINELFLVTKVGCCSTKFLMVEILLFIGAWAEDGAGQKNNLEPGCGGSGGLWWLIGRAPGYKSCGPLF